MSFITASSNFNPFGSYDFTGQVPRDFSARHAFVQAQAPLTKIQEGRFVLDSTGQLIPVPLFFETNDLLQTTADPSNVIQIFGDDSQSAPPFTQRRSGLLTTVDTANRVTVQNQRDITSYVVGDPAIYNTQFSTIQQAIDQAIIDGVDVNATPKREAQIIIKPGTYPDNIIIPRHGISLIALASGDCKDVTISGTLTIAPLDGPSKTLILLRGLHFEPASPPAITVTTPIAFNPKVLIDDCIIEERIDLSGLIDNVELTIKNSTVADVALSGANLVTLDLDNTTTSTVFLHSTSSFLTAANNSQCSLSSSDPTGSPPLLSSSVSVSASDSIISGSINAVSGSDHSGQNISLTLSTSFINSLIAYGQFSALSLTDCTVETLVFGDPLSTNSDNIFVQPGGTVLFQKCTWSSPISSLTLNLKTATLATPQYFCIDNCAFPTISAVTTPRFSILDTSAAPIPAAQSVFMIRNTTLTTPAHITGPNVDVSFLNCVHDITGSNVDIGGGNYAAIFGGSSISPSIVKCYNNTYTMRNATANDFVLYAVDNFNWTYKTVAAPTQFPCNVITNSGSTAANLFGGPGTVTIVDSGFSMV